MFSSCVVTEASDATEGELYKIVIPVLHRNRVKRSLGILIISRTLWRLFENYNANCSKIFQFGYWLKYFIYLVGTYVSKSQIHLYNFWRFNITPLEISFQWVKEKKNNKQSWEKCFLKWVDAFCCPALGYILHFWDFLFGNVPRVFILVSRIVIIIQSICPSLKRMKIISNYFFDQI